MLAEQKEAYEKYKNGKEQFKKQKPPTPAKQTPAFKAGKQLKEAINN